MTSLLISFQSAEELTSVADILPDWIDLKNPAAGPLGCPDRNTAKRFVEAAAKIESTRPIPKSIALGELDGSEWQQLRDVASEFEFAKIGLSQLAAHADLSQRLGDVIDRLDLSGRLIATYYADASIAQSPNWLTVLSVTQQLGSPYVLIDTFDKSQGRLWDWCSSNTLQSMMNEASSMNIKVALAGSIALEEIPRAGQLKASIVGLRSAVCQNGARFGSLCRDRLMSAKRLLGTEAIDDSTKVCVT